MKAKAKTKFKLSSLIIKFVLAIFILFIIILGSFVYIIRKSVNDTCLKAQSEYGYTCVKALITLIENPDRDFHSKNDAIWTLGRLGDREGLQVLQSIYTGNIPEREPYDEMISQYEIKKAILLIDKNADVSPRKERTLKEKLFECLPKSDMQSKEICDALVKTISSYQECADAGFPIQESYPERCLTSDGRTFINN